MAEPSRAPLSVVVPTRDRPAHLDACLAALGPERAPQDEIIVVDSASRSGDTAAVARRHGIEPLIAERPGTSLARNLGWRVARHQLVVFVDDDIRVRRGWADAMADAADRHPQAAFVTGAVHLPADQRDAEHAVAVKTEPEPATLTATTRGTLGGSCNLLVRRSALELTGGFDEQLGPGTWFASAEDLDLYDRLFGAGMHGRYEPRAEVEHVQWRSRRQLLRLDWNYGKGMGARIARLSVRDRRRAALVVREALWDHGVRHLVRDLRNGYEFGVAAVAARTLATVAGFLAAWVRGVAP